MNADMPVHSREDLLEVVDSACGAIQTARDKLEELYDYGLPEGVVGEAGEENAKHYMDSLDDALFNVKVADEQFDHCYAILAGEWDE